MRWLAHCTILILLSLTLSCEGPLLLGYDTAALPEYGGTMNWRLLTDHTSFSNRVDHSTIVFDDKIFVLGGYDISQRGEKDSYMEDVWSSSDGISWQLVSASAPWKGRRGMAVAVFNGYIYLAGGFAVDEETRERGYRNDVYRSQDGLSWECVSSSNDWEPRKDHALLVSGGALYLLGGMTNGRTYFSDMWRSTDGVNWELIPEGTLPGGRASFASTVDENGDIYLIGGSYEDMSPGGSGSIDQKFGPGWDALWRFSPDDPDSGWQQLDTPRTKTACRAEHALVDMGGVLFLLPGRANSSYRFSRRSSTYSIECFEDGAWHTDSIGPPIPPMYGYGWVLFPLEGVQRLFVIGGVSDNGPQNDVYMGTMGGEI